MKLTLNIFSNQKLYQRIVYLFICIGIFLAIYQFFYNRSLWLDEAMLSLNIVNNSFFELLEPLNYKQAAPIGFLWVEKFFASIFNNNDWALRIYPLISFFLSIYIIYRLFFKLSSNKYISLLSVGLYSIDSIFLRYATEVKQYQTDVLMFSLILYATLSTKFYKKRDIFLYTLLTVVSIWFSNISILAIIVAGLYLLITKVFIDKIYNVLIVFVGWFISFGVYYYYFIYDHPLKAFMINYWKEHFLPLNHSGKEVLDFLRIHFQDIYDKWLLLENFWVAAIWISVLGIVYLIFLKNFKLLYFVLFPILLHLTLSAFKLYPFEGRLVLYLMPSLLLILFYGLFAILKKVNAILKILLTRKFKRSIQIPIVILIIPIIFVLSNTLENFPIERQNIKSSLSFIEKNIKDKEPIYIYFASKYAFAFYKNKYPNLLKHTIVIGKDHKNQWEKHYDDIRNIDSDFWMIFSHVRYSNESGEPEDKYVIRKLSSEGYKIIITKRDKGSRTYKVSKL
jgi:dolichyl-phosphate-mannose-protein mannosyltransferase